MDTTKKLQSLESQKNQFLYSLTLHSLLVALTCSLLWYNLSWFLSLPSSLSTSLLSPKCLFVIVNVIVVFLVGESKLSGANSLVSPPTQIYDEYVERSRNVGSTSSALQQQTETVKNLTCQDKEVIELPQEEVKEVVQVEEKSDKKEVEVEESKIIIELEDDHVDKEEKENCGEEESECDMPTEELNKRVEEFIARVNKQRWLEARFLVSCEA